jgi:hypothetical protein
MMALGKYLILRSRRRRRLEGRTDAKSNSFTRSEEAVSKVALRVSQRNSFIASRCANRKRVRSARAAYVVTPVTPDPIFGF